MADPSSDRLKEKIEVLDGSRSGDRKRSALRIQDLQAILDYAPKLKSASAAGAAPTKVEHDALVTDLLAIHKALLAVSAAINLKLLP
ncbi:hypothetical protein LJR231_001564 [Phyllobacterium sp. LjRoot231]|uniref:hypothetical protein n=1 Tax=Phyllobacterium sp. LjRoot231 TaxID=3342289 RepID=UPI003ECEBBFD